MKHLSKTLNVALEENAEALAQAEAEENPVVVMNGPLSTIYTKALNLAMAKTDDATLAIESQQIDATVAAAQAERNEPEDPGTEIFAELPYNYSPSVSKSEDEVVVKAMNQIGKQPGGLDFVFYQDATSPSITNGDIGGDTGERALAIESIEIRVKLKPVINRGK